MGKTAEEMYEEDMKKSREDLENYEGKKTPPPTDLEHKTSSRTRRIQETHAASAYKHDSGSSEAQLTFSAIERQKMQTVGAGNPPQRFRGNKRLGRRTAAFGASDLVAFSRQICRAQGTVSSSPQFPVVGRFSEAVEGFY